MLDKIQQSFDGLRRYCEQEEFKGWDPYDGLNSKVFQAIPVIPKKRLTRLIWIQLIKKLPFNLRSILKIEKGINPKGIALFLSGYCRLSNGGQYKVDTKQKINDLAYELMNSRTEGFSGSCWGYNFDWESRAFFQKKFTPTIVATTYAANALFDAFDLTGNQVFFDAAISAKDFLLKDLNRTYDAHGNFVFSYSPFDKTSVFNASLLGARLLSRMYAYSKEPELAELSKKAVAYCCQYQNSNGSWYYSTLPFHQWIDNFHTGFNLECISDYTRYTQDRSFMPFFDKGLAYYLNTFFDEQGRSKYYNNALYPIDIHAPSQLVITLSKSGLFKENIDLINRVLNWTIENMQSDNGYFYFQKRKNYTNRIPYMRWSEGWMFLALATYIANSQLKKEVIK